MAAKLNIGPWVPENAIQAFSGLSGMASTQEQEFIQRLFEAKDLRGFWTDFSSAGYPFFSEFLYRIIRAYRAFLKSENLPVRRQDAIEGLTTLHDRFHEIEKLIENIRKQRFIEAQPFDDLLANIRHCQFEALPMLVLKIEQASRIPKKTPHRPFTRQSFNRDVPTTEVTYLGRVLYNFFQQKHIQKDWKKTNAKLKSHVCEIVNVLIDRPDDPLTLHVLTDYINNFDNTP